MTIHPGGRRRHPVFTGVAACLVQEETAGMSDRYVRLESAVAAACAEADSVRDLCQHVHRSIVSEIPADRWCGFAVDPATMFATNGYHDEGIDLALLPRLLEIEYGEVDRAQVPDLVRSATGVARLSEVTGGDLATSARWRDVLEPSGLGHEMRAVFRDGRHAWGALILFRGTDVDDFSPAEADLLRRLTPTIAAGFRRVLVRQHLDYGDDVREAGIVLLAGEPLVIRTATEAARMWLAELDDGATPEGVPTVILSAARAAQSADRPVAARARTRRGRWLTITAERAVSDDGAREIGIVVQPSRPAEIAQIVSAGHGLTPRESDVVLLVASGCTNAEIARSLGLSTHTVSDHLKNIFAKVGVSTRGELTSKLFFDHYLPRASGGQATGIDSWFLPA